MISSNNISTEVDRLYRQQSGKLITSLVSFFKLTNLEMAEDIVQHSFLAAIDNWSQKGLPDDPVAWLFRVCKNNALNAIKKESSTTLNPDRLSSDLYNHQLKKAFLEHEVHDNQLRMLFATCHPNFSIKSQVILTLKTLAGFKVVEIARALGMKPEAVKKNLTRTRQQIARENMTLKVPFRMQSLNRLNAVHQVLYLIFNEGFQSSSGDVILRTDFCLQALRLMKSLQEEEKIGNSDTQALYALMVFNVARFEAKVDMMGDLVLIKDQIRSKWDQQLIKQAIHYFNQAKECKSWSKYHYEAAIASLHCTANTFETTNWKAIYSLYEQLYQLHKNPFVALNKYIALFYSGNAALALEGLTSLNTLNDSHYYHAALAEIYHHLGQPESAMDRWLDALNKAPSDNAKRLIQEKINKMQNLLS